MIIKKIFSYFDRLEDRVRSRLSKHPNIYAFISGIGIVLFFRGIWLIIDNYAFLPYGHPLDGWISLGISLVILLLTGTLVSHHLQLDVLMSGKRGDKKLSEKINAEWENEETQIKKIQDTLTRVEEKLSELTEKIKS